ncbi:hypothetical protein IQ22_03017 [Pseudomonas duriflava]|uniref:Scaffold protein FimL second domain-containing protein n=1 Tax=Pseudomonas duriflava TaxID=459528 RepID=A0A562QAH3_9PSED|nr:ferrous iron transporter B [Pseudomonas duriflava]TWI53170.1 hypothetical protein IQ22_03017 [Pseudomonas duriflava]
MVTGARALGLVRDELFATIEQAEQNLERFILERHCSSLLQRAVECIHQIRGALSLIELTGAELLAQEAFDLVMDIPAGAGGERDEHLMALCHALHVLRRYLEQLHHQQDDIPEVLLPVINELRHVTGQPALPECYFFSVRLDLPRPASHCPDGQPYEARLALARRMRQMYQIGLMGLLRGNNVRSGLRLMERALSRLDSLLHDRPGARLCWIGAATLEAFNDGALLPHAARKQLFAKLDRELRQLLTNADYEPPRSILKDLLYLAALSEGRGARVTALRSAFAMEPLSYTDRQLEETYRRLTGPGVAVMQSLSLAIQEELNTAKELLDLIERDAAESDAYARLYVQLGILAKTLVMIEQGAAGKALQAHLPMLNTWAKAGKADRQGLDKLADAILYVESLVASLERYEGQESPVGNTASGHEAESFASHLLMEAHVLLLEEAKSGLVTAKQAISAYLDSRGEVAHLASVPGVLHNVRGALWFLAHERAAELTGICAQYIQVQMMDSHNMPTTSLIEVLADALSSIEFFLESGALAPSPGRPDILEVASDSVCALGWRPVAAA